MYELVLQRQAEVAGLYRNALLNVADELGDFGMIALDVVDDRLQLVPVDEKAVNFCGDMAKGHEIFNNDKGDFIRIKIF